MLYSTGHASLFVHTQHGDHPSGCRGHKHTAEQAQQAPLRQRHTRKQLQLTSSKILKPCECSGRMTALPPSASDLDNRRTRPHIQRTPLAASLAAKSRRCTRYCWASRRQTCRRRRTPRKGRKISSAAASAHRNRTWRAGVGARAWRRRGTGAGCQRLAGWVWVLQANGRGNLTRLSFYGHFRASRGHQRRHAELTTDK